MDAVDNFAFLVPIMMATFGCIFLGMSRFDLPTSASWGLAFLFGAMGFAIPLVPIPVALNALVADALFLASFFYYGHALLQRFGLPLRIRERFAFCALSMLLDCYVVLVRGSLHAELLLVDVSVALLLGFPWFLSLLHAAKAVDKALVVISGLVVLDTLSRVLIFTFLVNSSDELESFDGSGYAYFMQVSAGVLSLSYALIALGSIILETLGRYRDAAERDPLTGLLNRRGFDAAVAVVARRRGAAGVLVMCDIDHFKQVNDRFGHSAGDRVIASLAEYLRRDMPASSITARFGGEEFVIFLPSASLDEGRVFAQAVRMRFGAHDWRAFGIEGQITASFGVAGLFAGDDDLPGAITRADGALYAAKSAGRNRVVMDREIVEEASTVIPLEAASALRKARG